jgi:RND family efflux transporter MFP subunit
MKTLFFSKTAFVLIGATAFFLQSCGKSKPETGMASVADTIPVKVVSLEKSNADAVINASGQFTTDDETYLSFLTGGIVKQLLVKEGDRVRKGQLLATLDLTSINSMVNQAKFGLEKANRDLVRVTNLQKDGFATLEQMQNAQTAVDIAQQQLESARFNLKYSEIRALQDGFVLKRFVNQGQLVSTGTPVFQTNGAGDGKWYLKVGVSDREWNSISEGDVAYIQSEVFDKPVKAIVSRKAESSDPYTGTFAIDLTLTALSKTPVASGMFGKAEIHPLKKADNWTIPYAALLDGDANEGFVFVTDDGKTVQKIPVQIAAVQHHSVVISGGLENHKQLVVSGSAYLNEASIIRIRR